MVQPGRVPSPVFVMGRMPGADGVEVWLGALDGVYTLVDPLGAATVERFAPYQRVDDRSPFLACDRCGPRVDHYAAGMSSVTALVPALSGRRSATSRPCQRPRMP